MHYRLHYYALLVTLISCWILQFKGTVSPPERCDFTSSQQYNCCRALARQHTILDNACKQACHLRDVCIFENLDLCHSVGRSVGRCGCRFSGGGKLLAKHGGSTKNRLTWYAHASAFDFHVVKFWSTAYYTKTLWHLQVIMELFLSANIHQGNDLFSVYSRGRQCAFMCLSALLTARNNPVVVWSKQH